MFVLLNELRREDALIKKETWNLQKLYLYLTLTHVWEEHGEKLKGISKHTCCSLRDLRTRYPNRFFSQGIFNSPHHQFRYTPYCLSVFLYDWEKFDLGVYKKYWTQPISLLMQSIYENKDKFLKCLKLYFGLGLYYFLNVTTIIMIHLKTNEKNVGVILSFRLWTKQTWPSGGRDLKFIKFE